MPPFVLYMKRKPVIYCNRPHHFCCTSCLFCHFNESIFHGMLAAQQEENNVAICCSQISIKEQTKNMLFICKTRISESARKNVGPNPLLCVNRLLCQLQCWLSTNIMWGRHSCKKEDASTALPQRVNSKGHVPTQISK